MVEVCRARGLDVAEADVVSYLESLPDASLGGLFAAQVVEHLQPGYLLRFLELAFHKLRPGAPIVLETLNPACWTAFFDSFIRDITHVWPLHPDTLNYLVLASGFSAARIEYRSPVARAGPPAARAPRRAARRRPRPGRLRRDLQRQRREAERPDVHLPGLRHRRASMTLLSRAGWLLCAVLFATVLSSILHVDHAGWLPNLLLAGFVVFACVSPHRALVALLAVVPVALYLATQMLKWNSSLAWAEALACAALTGFAVDAASPLARARRASGDKRLAPPPTTIAAPALLFGALVLASLAAGLSVLALKFGPAFSQLIVSQLTREYFTDMRTFPGLHAGMLLLEGTLLAVHGARLAAERPIVVNAARAMAVGGALSAAFTLLQLLQAAWTRPVVLLRRSRSRRHGAVERALRRSQRRGFLLRDGGARRRRAGLARARRGASRMGGVRRTDRARAVADELTHWRAGGPRRPRGGVPPAPAHQGPRRVRPRRRDRGRGRAALSSWLPSCSRKSGIQQGVGISTDVRIGLIQTGLRMIRTHPVFGIGLGEFYPRSAEYSSPELLAKFPAIAARGENAHNNFVQVAAELGIVGGIFFTWLVAAALFAATRRALAAGDRFLLLVAAGVGAFALTMIGGHPLLIPEPGYMFWAMAGIAAGTRPSQGTAGSRQTAPARTSVVAGDRAHRHRRDRAVADARAGE